MREVLRSALACPACHGDLEDAIADDSLVCQPCGRSFRRTGNAWLLRLDESSAAATTYQRGVRGRLRTRVPPGLLRLFAPVLITGPRWTRSLAATLADDTELVVDVGSGNSRSQPAVVTVDMLAYPEVDIVADAARLPFRAGSVRGLVSIALLEHVPSSAAVLEEWGRVLSPGGRLFLVVPFLQPFHAAPEDYRRWTLAGLEQSVAQHFVVRDSGVYCGPTSTLVWIVADWLALVLSLGSLRLRSALSYALQALLSPCKWLDLIVARLPGADGLASALFVEAERAGPPTK
ncbi:MAG: methyltransferase domain-containing protein [Planctomycetota bacterium]